MESMNIPISVAQRTELLNSYEELKEKLNPESLQLHEKHMDMIMEK